MQSGTADSRAGTRPGAHPHLDVRRLPYRPAHGGRRNSSASTAAHARAPGDGQEFLALAVAAQIKSTVKRYPLDDANRALQDLKASRFNGEAILQVTP